MPKFRCKMWGEWGLYTAQTDFTETFSEFQPFLPIRLNGADYVTDRLENCRWVYRSVRKLPISFFDRSESCRSVSSIRENFTHNSLDGKSHRTGPFGREVAQCLTLWSNSTTLSVKKSHRAELFGQKGRTKLALWAKSPTEPYYLVKKSHKT